MSERSTKTKSTTAGEVPDRTAPPRSGDDGTLSHLSLGERAARCFHHQGEMLRPESAAMIVLVRV